MEEKYWRIWDDSHKKKQWGRIPTSSTRDANIIFAAKYKILVTVNCQ